MLSQELLDESTLGDLLTKCHISQGTLCRTNRNYKDELQSILIGLNDDPRTLTPIFLNLAIQQLEG
jgi:hypothetical protein